MCRPDIAYAVHVLQCYQANPGLAHWTALVRLSGYLKKTKDLGSIFKDGRQQDLVGFSDADSVDTLMTGNRSPAMSFYLVEWLSCGR